jgi:hypothetical protein
VSHPVTGPPVSVSNGEHHDPRREILIDDAERKLPEST